MNLQQTLLSTYLLVALIGQTAKESWASDPFSPPADTVQAPDADSDGDGLTDKYEIGHGRYAAIKGDFDWNKAFDDATKRGGHIATITSKAEWEAVKEVLGTIPHGYYLGATDLETEGVWQWITGETWSFTMWAQGEPNNLPRSLYGDEDFAQTWTATSDGNRLWNDIYGKKNPWVKGYILEFGFYTDPNKADSDGDGVGDGVEVSNGTDPNNPEKFPIPRSNPPEFSPGESPVFFKEKVDQLEKEVESLQNELRESELKVEQLMDQLQSREDRIAFLEKSLEEKDDRIANLESELIQRRHSQQKAQEEADTLAQIVSVPFVNGWVYLPEQGWMWTNAQVYPYVFRSETNSWCYFEQGTLPRLFFDDSNQKWEAWDSYEEPAFENESETAKVVSK